LAAAHGAFDPVDDDALQRARGCALALAAGVREQLSGRCGDDALGYATINAALPIVLLRT
jgi:hypothetical protein